MTTSNHSSSWLAPRPPTVALELANGWVSAVGVHRSGGGDAVTGHAVEPLAPGAVAPSLTGSNIVDGDAVAAAARRAIERAGLGSVTRAALILPDSVARVSLFDFEVMPSKATELDHVLEWRLKKSTPFPMEEARVSHFVAHAQEGSTTLAAVVARRDVIAQYEAVATVLGIRAGVVDLASFNIINVVLASQTGESGDWLVLHLTPEATTIAIMRGSELMFYRQRATVDGEPLSALVHQTAMYHEDRLGGGSFARVWLAGKTGGTDIGDARADLEARLGASVETVDVRLAAGLGGRTQPVTGDLDAIAAPAGVLLRDGRVG